jgi:hypothetical protein
MDLASLIRLEEHFWRASGRPLEYAARLGDDAVHPVPGLGILDREPVLAAMGESAPWEEFSIEHPRVVSVYRRNGAWRLVIHQQTPLDPTEGEAGAQ